MNFLVGNFGIFNIYVWWNVDGRKGISKSMILSYEDGTYGSFNVAVGKRKWGGIPKRS
jgi:hypothetical protein